ncbi:MAG: hypothetical protein E7262_06480 [Lachnospiraceae bacterium]|nr:hypothetical protein [Lachnospiraceae bacterium]
MREYRKILKSFISICLVVNMCINLFDVSIRINSSEVDSKSKSNENIQYNESKIQQSVGASVQDEIEIEERKMLSVEESVEDIIEEHKSKEFRENVSINENVVMFVMISNKSTKNGADVLKDDSFICKEYGLTDVEFITEVPYGLSFKVDNIDETKQYLVSYKAKTDKDIWDVIDELNKRDDILGAEPGYTYEQSAVGENKIPNLVSAPYMQMQWYLDDLGMMGNWNEMERNGYEPGRDVVVAVIDTGVQYTHEALRDAMWLNTNEIAGNGKDDDNNGYIDDYYGVNIINPSRTPLDDNGHGTNMSGIIAMQAVGGRSGSGIAYNAKIMPIKAADAKGEFNQDDVAKAINYATHMKADIINMSFGGEKSLVIEVAAKNAYDEGCILIAAAGNDGVPTSDGKKYFGGKYDAYDNYPAASTYVVGVMAYNQNKQLCSFSNWDYQPGNSIEYDIIAPGSNMYCPDIGGNKYSYTSGTSAATAVVSAMAANFRSIYKDKTKYKSSYIIAKLKSNKYISYKDKNGKIHKYVKLNSDLYSAARTFGKVNIAACTIVPPAYTYIYTGGEIKPSIRVKYGNVWLQQGTYYSVEYEDNVDIGKCTVTVKAEGEKAYGTKKLNLNIIPPALEETEVETVSKNSIRLKWKNNDIYDGYEVYRFDSVQKKYRFVKYVVNAGEYVDTKLNAGITYYYKVRGYKESNKVKYCSAFSETLVASTELNKTRLVYNSTSSSSIKLAWYTVTGATGYELFKYNSASKAYKKIAILPASKTVYLDTGLQPLSKNYYVVRAYKKVNDETMYAEYSEKLAAYVAPGKVTNVSTIAEVGRKVLISWNKVQNASGYQVYVADAQNGNYRLMSNIAPQYLRIRVVDVPTNKTFYYKVRSYKKIDGKILYGDFSEPKPAKAR